MEAKYNEYNEPLCPDCQYPLGYECAGNRDTETMGGYSIEYCICDRCNTKWHIVFGGSRERTIYPEGEQT